MSKYDYMFKLLLIGDSSVGKTCLLYRLCDDTFNNQFISTVGIDFKMKNLNVDGKGHSGPGTVPDDYKCLLQGFHVFSVDSRKSFESIHDWLKSVEENCSPNVIKIIVGNKCDLEDKRQVSAEEAKNRYGAKYMEVSAKSGLNVQEAFLTMTKDLKHLVDTDQINFDTGHRLAFPIEKKEEPPKHTSCCGL